jgi:hypothetical protein
MSDDELATAVRESVTGVHMNIPAELIISRSRAIRARRRIPAVAGAVAMVAAVVLAVTALLPSSHQPGRSAGTRLAAWTVVKEADGGIRVTIRELRHPARLQRKLRADGVPASVTFTGHPNPACHSYRYSGSKRQRRQLLNRVFTSPRRGDYNLIVIHPAALPTHAGVLISVRFHHYWPGPKGTFELQEGLVKTSPKCTGS